jgi:RraA family protein
MLTAETPAATTPKSADLHPGVGFQIRTSFQRPAPHLIEEMRTFDTPDISDMMNRLATMSSEIHNLCNDAKIVGPACTVKVFPGDNLMVHKALDIAQPGDIMVVDAGGSRMNGLIGDLISTKAKHRGIAAFVIDGLIRDLPEVQAVGLPVFARGVTPIGPLHRGPGEINYPISCGGIVVNPGDLIVGDANGLVVVRQDVIETILARLRAQQGPLQKYVANVKRGVFSNAWVTTLLTEAGCPIEE